MVQLLKRADAKLLDLPGRRSREAVSGAIGSRMSFRIVEIAQQQISEAPRGPHLHRDFEECIYVLSGRGMMRAESGGYPVGVGDVLLVPPGRAHDRQHRIRTPHAVVLLPCSGRRRRHHRVQEFLMSRLTLQTFQQR